MLKLPLGFVLMAVLLGSLDAFAGNSSNDNRLFHLSPIHLNNFLNLEVEADSEEQVIRKVKIEKLFKTSDMDIVIQHYAESSSLSVASRTVCWLTQTKLSLSMGLTCIPVVIFEQNASEGGDYQALEKYWIMDFNRDGCEDLVLLRWNADGGWYHLDDSELHTVNKENVEDDGSGGKLVERHHVNVEHLRVYQRHCSDFSIHKVKTIKGNKLISDPTFRPKLNTMLSTWKDEGQVPEGTKTDWNGKPWKAVLKQKLIVQK